MKYVFIIALFAAVALFVYWRLRPYLKMARNVLGFVRDVQRVSTGTRAETPQRSQQRGDAVEKLVRCSSCGTWLPASRAVALRSSKESYCSHECMERSVGRVANEKTVRRS